MRNFHRPLNIMKISKELIYKNNKIFRIINQNLSMITTMIIPVRTSLKNSNKCSILSNLTIQLLKAKSKSMKIKLNKYSYLQTFLIIKKNSILIMLINNMFKSKWLNPKAATKVKIT